MFSHIRNVVISSFILLATPALAASIAHQNLVNQAVERFTQANKQHWSYQVHSIEIEEGEKTEVLAQHIPHANADKRWHLLQLNGKKPSSKQAEKFAKKRQNEGFSVSIKELIKTDALTLHHETPEYITFTYPVELSDLGEDALGKLVGSIQIDKRHLNIDHISIHNTDEFSPVALAEIDHFKLHMQFMTIDNTVLPKYNTMEMTGTFSFFIEIEETSKTTFSNYQKHLVVTDDNTI
ncbi:MULTISPECIES: hypothetical protein [Pseudoalteromonas]|uniref:Uncharacterized protein n=1 Tax=Pseudoalteromonas luteoviolacea (strain 2ta16) TaxID=1353533 RepID=V4HPA9_PSEL2|nr:MULTISPECIES: hypothetical protein [Pseudoalteromonas]ESP92650.1 hypothetical protein PL2TA16_03848 [Pseudoalteromonas luteoviolacea 2ta16]KZN35457.1 hypothetical protein N483_00465 [Pseudoalteromonas luteoviolacea NCIMB 1944]MCG7546569.1 hypothetical protein [Pseudoalteromonas sp. Of7M-16]